MSRLAPSRAVVAVALAALVGTTTACQQETKPTRYAALDDTICDAQVIPTVAAQLDPGQPLEWDIHDSSAKSDEASVECRASMSGIASSMADVTKTDLDTLQVSAVTDAEGVDSTRNFYQFDGSSTFGLPAEVKYDTTTDFPAGWWEEGWVRTGAWHDPRPRHERPGHIALTTVSTVRHANVAMQVTLLYTNVPISQVAAYTQKCKEASATIFESLGSALHKE